MKRLSLRARLVGLSVLAVALVWLLTAVATWREARHELEELLAHPPTTTAAHLARDREEAAGEIAGQLLKPMLYALPVLALLLVIAIGLALAPLRQLARDVSDRAPDRLDPLPSETLPAEVAPLVARLNSLFAAIVRALDNERRFTADAAHELRTPLAALKTQAQVALAAVDAGQRQHALGQILVGCERATHLVEQLLTLARLDAGTPDTMREVALRPIAEQVLAVSAGQAIEQHCELLLRDGDARIRGDAFLLQVMLRNLIDNALCHSGGTQVEVSVAQNGQSAVVTVSDDGHGIAEEERERVMRRFYRSAVTAQANTNLPNSKGSGLGLSIVTRIAELHGGTVGIIPAATGNGVSLRVQLPLAVAAPAPAPANSG